MKYVIKESELKQILESIKRNTNKNHKFYAFPMIDFEEGNGFENLYIELGN